MSIHDQTIHECLTPEQDPESGESERITIRLKAARNTKTKLEVICARHGTTPGAFLRKCAELVVAQYGDSSGVTINGHDIPDAEIVNLPVNVTLAAMIEDNRRAQAESIIAQGGSVQEWTIELPKA